MERRESRDHEEPNNKKDSIIKRGAWKPEEDLLLRKYIETYGEGKWTDVSKKSGLMRGAKSCRMRWKNHLRPNIKHGKISEDEEDLIIRMHKLLGNRWSLIAGRIPGRTDNEVKNYWNTHLSKRKLPHQQNRQGDSPTSFNPKKTNPTDTNITKHSTSTRRIGFNDEIRVSAKSTTTSTQPTSITESTRTNTTRIDRSYELDDTEVIYDTERIHQDMFMNNGLDDWSTSIQRTLSPNLAVDFSTLSCEDNGDVLSWWPKWDETIFYDETYCLPSLEEDYSILSVESLERSSEQSWNKNLNWL